MMTDWKRPLSWAALILALLGFAFSLGVHLAALGGLNVELSAPGLVQVLRYTALAALPVMVVEMIYFLRYKQVRLAPADATPAWIGPVLRRGLAVLIFYTSLYMVYGLLTLNIVEQGGWSDAMKQLSNVRDESKTWLVVYWFLANIIVQHGLDWKLLVPQHAPGQPVG